MKKVETELGRVLDAPLVTENIKRQRVMNILSKRHPTALEMEYLLQKPCRLFGGEVLVSYIARLQREYHGQQAEQEFDLAKTSVKLLFDYGMKYLPVLQDVEPDKDYGNVSFLPETKKFLLANPSLLYCFPYRQFESSMRFFLWEVFQNEHFVRNIGNCSDPNVLKNVLAYGSLATKLAFIKNNPTMDFDEEDVECVKECRELRNAIVSSSWECRIKENL